MAPGSSDPTLADPADTLPLGVRGRIEHVRRYGLGDALVTAGDRARAAAFRQRAELAVQSAALEEAIRLRHLGENFELFGPRQRTLDGRVEPTSSPIREPPPGPELPDAPLPTSAETCTPALFDRQEQLALAFEAVGLASKARRHRECNRTWSTYSCSACGADSHRAIATCDLRTCFVCARRDAGARAAELRRILLTVKRRAGHRLRLVTLTVRTGPGGRECTLVEIVRAIERSGAALPKLWRKLLAVDGAGLVASWELAPATGNVHLHCLYLGPWIDQSELSAEWHKLTGSPVVDVRAVDQGREGEAVAEVSKYVVKLDVRRSLLVKTELAFSGRRRLRTYGVFFDVPDDPDPPGARCPHCGECGTLQITRTRELPRPRTLFDRTRAQGPPGVNR